MGIFLKDPAAALDYAIDWSISAPDAWIAESGWTVAPADAQGLSVTGEGVSGLRTAATFSGGLAGCVYRITNNVLFADGRADSRTLSVRVEQR